MKQTVIGVSVVTFILLVICVVLLTILCMRRSAEKKRDDKIHMMDSNPDLAYWFNGPATRSSTASS